MKKKGTKILLLVVLHFFLQNLNAQNFTWLKGSSSVGATGIYGTINGASTLSTPPARLNAASAVDANGNIWMFGGRTGTNYYGDLWMYNPTTNIWDWKTGVNTFNWQGSTGGATNPSAREGASMSISGDYLYIYGGKGINNTGSTSLLSDVVRYNICCNNWTNLSGTNINTGASATNITNNPSPGPLQFTHMWATDSVLYLFGGVNNAFDDFKFNFFKFRLSTQTWIHVQPSYSLTVNGNYSNGLGNIGYPGARAGAVTWKNNDGTFALFGGYGYSIGGLGNLGDLWTYNANTNAWTWKTGSSALNFAGNYGTINTPSNTNLISARFLPCGGLASNNKTYIFGGDNSGKYNDVWEYDNANNRWMWIKGSSSKNQIGSFGTINVSNALNNPGGSYSSIGHVSGTNLYIFGGEGYASNSTNAPLDATWSYNLSSSLPLTLSSFTTLLTNKTTQLNWATSQETNTSHFEIEYSNNGKDFEKVASVAANGNSVATQNYVAYHTVDVQAKHYYRLKMIDKDGKYTYSQVVVINGSNTQAFSVVLQGNQVQNQLKFNITTAKTTTANISVKNSAGQVMLQQSKVAVAAGSNSFNYAVSHFSQGIYFLEIVDNTGVREIIKFLK